MTVRKGHKTGTAFRHSLNWRMVST